MSRIVLVEDDRAIATGLAMNLRFEGHDVQLAHDGESGLLALLEPDLDLAVLDVMLPGRNGLELLRELRARNPRVPVLMLSARGAEGDKVQALELGADDYVTKPFGLAELLARVKALLRRARPAEVVRFGEVEVALESQSVRRGGTPVELTTREYGLLKALIAAQGRTLSREQLLDLAWGVAYEGTARTVDTFMRQLRVKLESDPDNPSHLLTVRGRGYRFEP